METNRWPTIESRAYLPSLRVFELLGGVMTVAGAAAAGLLWPRFSTAWQRAGSLAALWSDETGGGWLVIWLLNASVSGFGLLILWAAFRVTRINWPFRHAADDVLPDVPRSPVNRAEIISYGQLTHAILPTEHGWCLRPRPNLFRFRPLYIGSFMLLVAALAIGMIAHGDFPRSTKLFAGMMFVMGGAVVVLVVVWFDRRALQQMLTLEVEPAAGVCRINSQPPREVSLADLVAVQLCACRCKLGAKRTAEIFDAVELNLVWTGPAEASDGCPYDRMTLLSTTGELTQQAQLASALADKLGVPLLYHATQEHWRVEREAAADRAPQSGGYSS